MTTSSKTPPKVTWKPYICTACGQPQSISTNHHGDCYDFCNGCSWMCKKYPYVILFGRHYRKFTRVK